VVIKYLTIPNCVATLTCKICS